MRFYLGVPDAVWLEKLDVPLFVSRRAIIKRSSFPVPICDWALDSGAFSEVSLNGKWNLSVKAYAEEIRICEIEIGRLQWAAPMDWMCEPWIIRQTGKSVKEHIALTVDNFLELRQEVGNTVIPVLQGWHIDDYLYCYDLYQTNGIDLGEEPVVGVGSVCRRQSSSEIEMIFQALSELDIQMHGFGVKYEGLVLYGDLIDSADSMAWSFKARTEVPLEGHTHKSCSSCIDYALLWRNAVVKGLEEGCTVLPWNRKRTWR
jgi:hypothetical protein